MAKQPNTSPVLAELAAIIAKERKAGARWNESAGPKMDAARKEYEAACDAGHALAERIWGTDVRTWDDVAARAALVEYFFIDWGCSPDGNKAVVELLLAIKIMLDPTARQVSVRLLHCEPTSYRRRRSQAREGRRGQA